MLLTPGTSCPHCARSCLPDAWASACLAGRQHLTLNNEMSDQIISGDSDQQLEFALLSAGHDPVQKLTLIPRGQAKGLTWFIPGEDPTLISKQQIFARIVGALGGRATEEVIWGEMEITTGASSDLAQVSNMARQMVSPPRISPAVDWMLSAMAFAFEKPPPPPPPPTQPPPPPPPSR